MRRRRARPSVVRAWLVAHDAGTAAAATTVVALALCVGSQWLLPVPGVVRVVPLWQLTPPALGALASLSTVNRLPVERQSLGLRVARAGWVLCVVLATSGAAWLVDLGSGLDTLVPATALLVGLTLTCSCLLGRMSVWVGGAAVVVVVLHTSRYAGVTNPWAPGPGPLWTVGAPVAVTGSVAYSWFGARTVRVRGEEGN